MTTAAAKRKRPEAGERRAKASLVGSLNTQVATLRTPATSLVFLLSPWWPLAAIVPWPLVAASLLAWGG